MLVSHLFASGALLLAGGGETTSAMIEKFAELCGGKLERVYVLAQTREEPVNGQGSVEMLREHGFQDVILVADSTFNDRRRAELQREFTTARGFWVPGGDQNLLLERFGAKWCQKTFPPLIRKGASWFGTSAGAMATSNPMIGGLDDDGHPLRRAGIGLVPFLVDTHFAERKREPRLREAMTWARQTGIGLDEGEWVVIRDGKITDQGGTPSLLWPRK